MHQVNFISAAKAAVVLLATVIMLGCTPSDEAETSAEPDLERLKTRVEERWQSLADHNYYLTYEYATPNYRRVFPNSLFVKKFSYAVNRELTGVEVTNYDARAAVASVAVRVMSSPTKQTSAASIAIGAVPVTINERWMFIDGEWWHSANF